MITVGILSDTHLSKITEPFKTLARTAFDDCDHIIHAGDLTSKAILEIFAGKVIHAVHGNMCSAETMKDLPHMKSIEIEGHTIGLCHGAGPRHNIEERMWALFPEAGCIIYGHTHQAVCHRMGGILFINPGSFQCTSAHGAPASYAKMEITRTAIKAQLLTLALQS